MRGMWGLALLVGCAQQATPLPPEMNVTPSDQRATADIVPQFSIEAAAGEQHVIAILFDRLEADRGIRLAATEHLFAVVGGGRVPLVEETYAIAGYENPTLLATRYTTTLTTDAQHVAIEFDRADGSIVTSTVNVPARYAVVTPPAANVKTGDQVSFSISPAPGADTFGYWDAWCDATPTVLIYDANVDEVYVSPAGQGTLQLGAQRYGTTTNCAGQLQLRLYADGSYDPAFAPTSPAPLGFQSVEVGVHLWGI